MFKSHWESNSKSFLHNMKYQENHTKEWVTFICKPSSAIKANVHYTKKNTVLKMYLNYSYFEQNVNRCKSDSHITSIILVTKKKPTKQKKQPNDFLNFLNEIIEVHFYYLLAKLVQNITQNSFCSWAAAQL